MTYKDFNAESKKALNKWWKELGQICQDCGSTDYPYHNGGCMMGDIGWRIIKKKGGR